jgi:WD40 repeat protein
MDPTTQASFPPQTQIRWACAELARRLRAGDPVLAEQWFDALPGLALDEELAVELIYTEFCTREELGQSPQSDDFVARFPRWEDALRRQFEVHQMLADGDALPALETVTPPTAAADRVGPFVIVRELGRGGMGVVYEARHAALGRIVALKMVSARPNERAALMARLNVEAQTVASLRHPNIVQLYEIGSTDDGRTFLAFEFMEAGSLAARIAGKPQDPRYAARILRQLAEGVATAHHAGVVHCDLTPGNILFASDGTPKIADFGLARWWRQDSTSHAGLELAGTPSYMAPEQIDNPREVGPAADIYALGAMLYEMLTGRPPLLAASPMETLAQVRSVEPVSPKQLRPSLPRDLATICLKCLEKDPRRRYASADDLAADLDRFGRGEPIAARSVGMIERSWKWSRRHPPLAVASVVAGLAVVALVVGGLWYNMQLQAALEVNEQQRGTLSEELDRSARNLFTMQLMQVEQLLERNPAQAAVMLDDEQRCPDSLRDFAWGMFRRRATQDRLTLGAAGPAMLTAGSTTDGRTIVAVSADRTVHWFDSTSGAEQKSGRFDVDAIGAAALSHDRTQLAVGDGRGVVRVWQLAQLDEPPHVLDPPLEADVTTIAWSHDGRRLAVGAGDGQLRYWNLLVKPDAPADAEVDEPLATWADVASDVGGVLSVSFSHDAALLASGGSDGVVRLWSTADGTPQGSLSGHRGGAKAIAFDAEGKNLAACALWDPRITWWRLSTRESQAIDTRGQPAHTIAISRDGTQLIAALADDSVRVYRLPTGEESLVYRGHTAAVHQVSIDSGDATIISAGGDGMVKLWDLRQAAMPTIVPADPLKTLSVAWSPDGRYLATAGHEGVIRIWDQAERREVSRLPGHASAVQSLRFVIDHAHLATASDDGTLRLWSIDARTHVWAIEHPALILDLRHDIEREQIVTIASDGQLRRWQLSDGTLVDDTTLVDGAITLGTLSSDGRRAAFVTSGEALSIWHEGDATAKPITAGAAVTALAFARNAQVLAIATADRQIMIYDVDQETPRHKLVGHTQLVTSLAFHGQGQTLFSGAGSNGLFAAGEVKLWDLATGQVHATLPGFNGPVSIDPTDRVLAVTDRDGRNLALWYTTEYRGD